MNEIYCKQEIALNDEEKTIFSPHLNQQQLSSNIWDLFQEWVELSDSSVFFFYLKVYQGNKLIGLGLFVKIKSYNLGSSYSTIRKNPFLDKIMSVVSSLGQKCLYVSLRNLITANICRPFFYKSVKKERTAMEAMLSYLKLEKDADMITIIDTAQKSNFYADEGYQTYPCPSEAWFDVDRYSDIHEYLKTHKSLKRNISRKKKSVTLDIFTGPLSEADKTGIKICLDCSIQNSRAFNPGQDFFEEQMSKTAIFDSNRYLHILVRVDQAIAGFHTFKISGSHMGGVLGGFNRQLSKNNYVYERIVVASLDYAIKNKLTGLHYSLVDNFTKLRLVDDLEPCHLYFYARNPINRTGFKLLYEKSDIHGLYMLEKKGLQKYSKK